MSYLFLDTDDWYFTQEVTVRLNVGSFVVAYTMVRGNRIQRAGVGNGIWCRRWETAMALFFLMNLSFPVPAGVDGELAGN